MEAEYDLRDRLVSIALEWETRFGVIPQITSAVAEFDAMRLVGCAENEYCEFMKGRTAVSKGYDFIHNDTRWQVKANRPSGKPGSRVTLVNRPRNTDWDRLIWILYDREYRMTEAWAWNRDEFVNVLGTARRLSPDHIRRGSRLL